MALSVMRWESPEGGEEEKQEESWRSRVAGCAELLCRRQTPRVCSFGGQEPGHRV